MRERESEIGQLSKRTNERESEIGQLSKRTNEREREQEREQEIGPLGKRTNERERVILDQKRERERLQKDKAIEKMCRCKNYTVKSLPRPNV